MAMKRGATKPRVRVVVPDVSVGQEKNRGEISEYTTEPPANGGEQQNKGNGESQKIVSW